MITAIGLKKIFNENIKRTSSGIGIDKMSKSSLEKLVSDKAKLERLCKKINGLEYNFTPYKEKLVLKGRGKVPRLISIPTFRDKLIFKYLNKVLIEKFYNGQNFEMAQVKISRVAKEIKKYDSFIKIDMSTFYDNIDHNLLLNKISSKKVRDSKVVYDLLYKAIRNATVQEHASKHEKSKANIKGVPQGLPISNILAEIYMEDFDEKYIKLEKIKYFRYVDDILLLYNKEDYSSSKFLLDKLEVELFNTLHLTLNKSKTRSGSLEKGVNYLGYELSSDRVTVKGSNKLKFERRLEKLFSEYKYIRNKNKSELNFFFWKLNNMITGVKIKKKKGKTKRYGWLFYFQKINDYELMYHLDSLVAKFCDRFEVPKDKEIKKFSRALYEIKNNKESTYILNIDEKYKGVKAKRDFLIEIAGYSEEEVINWKAEQVDYKFNGVIFKSLKDLEKDKVQEGY